MILLDTNIVSELMRPMPNPKVVFWLDDQPETDIWISAVTVSEILSSLALLPDGKRKWALTGAASLMFENDFAMRCLPFDCEAADAYALIVSQRNRKGRPISVEDTQIAAIALTADLTLATRNVKDFFGIDELRIINPWEM